MFFFLFFFTFPTKIEEKDRYADLMVDPSKVYIVFLSFEKK